jgi:sugar lactone lactonase YvrE
MTKTSLVAEPILQAQAALGEGAIWDGDQGVLHWIDIKKYLLHTFDPKTGQNTSINVGSPIGTVVKRAAEHGGGFIISLPEKFAHIDSLGTLTVLCELEKGLGNWMNDGKCDPAGRFWCGSQSLDFAVSSGNLWMLDIDHTPFHKLGNVTCSNGIVWTRDAKLMYYIDTVTGNVDAFDFDINSGAIANRRIAFRNIWGGYFDGMTIDADDNVYIAIWQGGAVYKINPKNGQLLSTIKVPGVKNVTSCAFGGPHLNDLYITSSNDGAKPGEEPNAGALFKITLTDVQGLPSFEFKG